MMAASIADLTALIDIGSERTGIVQRGGSAVGGGQCSRCAEDVRGDEGALKQDPSADGAGQPARAR
ncbi:hypothetical protein F753_18670 [Stutzerimonas chloritidismutans AW-1]|uniref:Uncharacterized protein n=1 Tax=Stutzerimonas chloritidismutans AW-1 TaxID=1263865 RepID=V4Q537_STUCH|nr:hypothetical protein F753_18670 [Stutzerimonas chloritidismutans AW-1]